MKARTMNRTRVGRRVGTRMGFMRGLYRRPGTVLKEFVKDLFCRRRPISCGCSARGDQVHRHDLALVPQIELAIGQHRHAPASPRKRLPAGLLDVLVRASFSKDQRALVSKGDEMSIR